MSFKCYYNSSFYAKLFVEHKDTFEKQAPWISHFKTFLKWELLILSITLTFCNLKINTF